jgi:AraC family transcriptional regulator
LEEVPGGLTPQKLRIVTDFIRENLAGNLVRADIADAAGISVHHLAHLFKRSTGLALHQYIVKARMEQATRLLTETNLSVREIARRVGYTHSRFSALFQRHAGTTPTRYRVAQK